jgi:septal ring factor EnvC (AmiA/AmiB activator)
MKTLVIILIAAFALPLHAQQRRVAESPVSAVERELQQKQSALDSVRTELERGRTRVRELQSEEGNYLGRLEQIERNISVSGRYMELLQRQIDTTETALAQLGDSLANAEANLRNAQELMRKRLRSAQRMGEVSRLEMLLTARNPAELVHRVRSIQDLGSYDRRLAESIRQHIATVGEKRTSQEENRRKLVNLLTDRRNEQTVLVEEETLRRSLLEEVRTRRSASETLLAELEEAHRGLDALIRMLEGRRRAAREEEERERQALVNFEMRKGRLSWPLRGEVTGRFGRVVHPVYRTVTMNDGIDIAAQRGTPVRNVAPGTVAHTGSMRGLGRFVLVDHGGSYFTIYSHLDEIVVRQEQNVGLGAELGKSGTSFSGPKLNFKIKKSVESLDPEEWLER